MTVPSADPTSSSPMAAPAAPSASSSGLPAVAPATTAGASSGSGSSGIRPSPYDALRAEGDGPPRSSDPSRRAKGPLGWLVNDAGLKILALLLSFMLWHVVRGRIDSIDTSIVEVTLIPPSADIRVVGGVHRGTVKLTLHGTRTEVDRVKSEFAKHGTISYRFEAPPGVDEGRVGPVSDPSHFEYLVEGAAAVVTDLSTPIEARWVRMEKRPIKFLKPRMEPLGADLKVGTPEFPDLPEQVVELEGPATMFRGPNAVTSIQPDPIDIRAWTDNNPEGWDPVTPVPFDLQFEEWRRSGSDRGRDLVTITPHRVKGKVKLLPRPLDTLVNVIRPLLATTDLEKYRDIEIGIKSVTAYDAATKRLSLSVRGDPKEIAALKANLQDWAFEIPVPLPPATGEQPVDNRPTRVSLWTKTGTAASSVELQADAVVTVTLTKK